MYTPLVQYNQGSMDPKYNTWFSHQIFPHSAPDTLSPSSPRPINDKGTGYDIIRGDSLLTEKISHKVPSSATGPRFLQQCLCGPKEGWGVETYYQSPEAEQLHSLSTLQDGKHFQLERHLEKGRLACQDDLKDAYLTVPMAEVHRKYLRFQ